jgi:hypothetical protein
LKFPLIVLVVLAACGDDDGIEIDSLLGAECRSDADCDERCLGPSNDFPDGMCSFRCDVDADCPVDAWCADAEGGVCLFTCRFDEDCDVLGGAWVCEERNAREDQNRKVSVCVGD